MFEYQLIKDKIHYFKFDNQYEACASFMRPQEFYECPDPKIRGQWFGLADLMDSYAEREGNFTYTLDWHGFNIPGDVFIKWYKKHHSFSSKECAIIHKMLKPLFDGSQKFYVIASSPSPEGAVIDHELCHALFYLDPLFKEDILDIVKNFLHKRNIDKIFDKLREKGYTEEVYMDELVAYLTTSSKYYIRDEFNMNNANLWYVRKCLRQIFLYYVRDWGCENLIKYKTP